MSTLQAIVSPSCKVPPNCSVSSPHAVVPALLHWPLDQRSPEFLPFW